MGVSANSMGLNDDKGFDWRGVAKVAIILTLIALLVGGAWLTVRMLSPLTGYQIKNDSFVYDVMFFKGAQPAYYQKSNALASGDAVVAVAKPITGNLLHDCHTVGSRWATSFTVTIIGKERPVCSADNQTYYTDFEAVGRYHSFRLVFSSTQKNDTGVIRQIIQSLAVRKQ